jgi:hypothetical protein
MRRTATLILCMILILTAQGCKESNDLSFKSVPENTAGHIPGSTISPSITTVPSITAVPLPTPLHVPRISCVSDKDGDGISDLDDIVEGARKDADNRQVYKSEYYSGGYPPDSEGVCTDVIWRAFKNAGYNLKDMIDKDIKTNEKQYPAVEGKPDPNIDFRRVRNLIVFFRKYATKLTLEIKPYDVENLREWQGGDIITFDSPEHIAIVSDRRRDDGVPYLIHNAGPYTMEVDNLMTWLPGITGHFRFPGS